MKIWNNLLIVIAIAINATSSSYADSQNKLPGTKKQIVDKPKLKNMQCKVPGISLHWQADYCMVEAETSDFQSDSVQNCMDRVHKDIPETKDPCRENESWKKKYCERAKKTYKNTRSYIDVCEKNGLPTSVANDGVDP